MEWAEKFSNSWRFWSNFFSYFKTFSRDKSNYNIDGIEWQRNKWKGLSKIFLKFSEFMAIKFSSLIVSDNLAITKYISENIKLIQKLLPMEEIMLFTKEKFLLTNENLKHGKSNMLINL